MAAPGISATEKSKCFRASIYARVGDFDSVSTTRVRFVRSFIPSPLVIYKVMTPPSADKRQDGMKTEVQCDNLVPVVTRAEVVKAEFDDPPATRTSVERTPIVGRNGDTFLMSLGNILAKADPVNNGTKTKDAIDSSTPRPLTSTVQPKRSCIRKGVANTPKSVVEMVHTTDNATSPPAIKLNKFDAWPPLTQPSKTSPIIWLDEYDRTLAML